MWKEIFHSCQGTTIGGGFLICTVFNSLSVTHFQSRSDPKHFGVNEEDLLLWRMEGNNCHFEPRGFPELSGFGHHAFLALLVKRITFRQWTPESSQMLRCLASKLVHASLELNLLLLKRTGCDRRRYEHKVSSCSRHCRLCLRVWLAEHLLCQRIRSHQLRRLLFIVQTLDKELIHGSLWARETGDQRERADPCVVAFKLNGAESLSNPRGAIALSDRVLRKQLNI